MHYYTINWIKDTSEKLKQKDYNEYGIRIDLDGEWVGGGYSYNMSKPFNAKTDKDAIEKCKEFINNFDEDIEIFSLNRSELVFTDEDWDEELSTNK